MVFINVANKPIDNLNINSSFDLMKKIVESSVFFISI